MFGTFGKLVSMQLRLLAGETAHADHAALGLHLEGQHHQGDQQAEEDDGQTVALLAAIRFYQRRISPGLPPLRPRL